MCVAVAMCVAVSVAVAAAVAAGECVSVCGCGSSCCGVVCVAVVVVAVVVAVAEGVAGMEVGAGGFCTGTSPITPPLRVAVVCFFLGGELTEAEAPANTRWPVPTLLSTRPQSLGEANRSASIHPFQQVAHT